MLRIIRIESLRAWKRAGYSNLSLALNASCSSPRFPIEATTVKGSRFMALSSSAMDEGLRQRQFGSVTSPSTEEKRSSVTDEAELRTSIIASALEQVHQYGWTDDAIVQGLLSDNRPLSLAGVIGPTDLIHCFMNDCQERLQNDMASCQLTWEQQNVPISGRLVQALRKRLECVVPFVDSKRWHEAMAMGATQNSSVTASQLKAMVDLIADSVVHGTDENLGHLERAGLGSIYVATELHMLSAVSKSNGGIQPTWDFLEARVKEWEQLRQATLGLSTPLAGDSVVAASAVLTSLGGAALSLLQPVARDTVSAMTSTVVPHLATLLQLSPSNVDDAQGTRPSDYDPTKKP